MLEVRAKSISGAKEDLASGESFGAWSACGTG